MNASATVLRDWNDALRRVLPDPPLEPLFEGAPEGRDFREREAVRLMAAITALAIGLHLPVRGGVRHPTRVVASILLSVGAIGLLSHRRWPEAVTLGGAALAAGTMLARPLPMDSLASVAATVTTLAVSDIRRVPRRW